MIWEHFYNLKMKNKFDEFIENESKKEYFIDLFALIENESKSNNIFPK